MLNYLGLLIIAYSLYLMNRVKHNTQVDSPLTTVEKVQVIITLILGAPFTYFIYKFGWQDKLPTKAAQVRKYFWRMIIWLIGIGILAFVVAVLLSAISKSHQL